MHFDLLWSSSPAIVVHTVLAFGTLVLGGFVMLSKKGTAKHKLAGRLFLGLMIGVAITALFIRGLNGTKFSWIHIFVPVTLFAAWETVYYIRKNNLKGHKRAVKGLFFGELLIPGALSFLPGRLMWAVVFGRPT